MNIIDTPEIRKIGETLMDFSYEILNAFSTKEFLISNAKVEANNNKIGKIINVSYGVTNFTRFRKRVLFIDEKNSEE